MSFSYKESGVDLEGGKAFIDFLRSQAKKTERKGVPQATLRGFHTYLDPRSSGYRDPLLVMTADGVGTKLDLAVRAGRHYEIGIDLVAMNVNDLVISGAEPMVLLDYYAYSEAEASEALFEGIVAGCREAGCALVGGESAQMPGMYAPGVYDIAGFALGMVERENALPRGNIQEGDRLVGLASNGVHSNGFSLIRHLMASKKLEVDDTCPFEEETTLGEALLRPTRIYVKPILELLRKRRPCVKGMIHITGGGLVDNIPLVVPSTFSVTLETTRWSPPAVFDWIAAQGVSEVEMRRTFNCGIGLILIVSPRECEKVIEDLRSLGEIAYDIGGVTEAGSEAVAFQGELFTK